jgi:hypothetical protein
MYSNEDSITIGSSSISHHYKQGIIFICAQNCYKLEARAASIYINHLSLHPVCEIGLGRLCTD